MLIENEAHFLSLPPPLQQAGVSHMQGMMAHQALGQQLVHPTPVGGAQMQGQWRQPLGGETAPPAGPEDYKRTSPGARLRP